jgi:ABC-type nickel/cobalt efflux system permease component RcnA
MMNGLLWGIGGVGFVLGMRHALDPDHIVAVSTIASEQRSLRRSSLLGAFWGLGHGLTLMCVSGAVLALKVTIPAGIAQWLEAGVAIMLVVLGVGAVRRAVTEWDVHAHRHIHGGHEHVHFHEHHVHEHGDHEHRHLLGFGWRPFTIGVVHGLAGSAGLAILAVGTSSSVSSGLLYIGMLGLGSAVGMLALTGIMSLPLYVLAKRFRTFRGAVQLIAGLSSVVFGFWFGSSAIGG